MEYQKLMLEKQDRVCLVKINHPEALNALNTVILQELDRAFDEIAADPETDVVILTGEGRSFVAGADIAEMSVMKAEEGRRFGELGAAVFRKIELMAKPVIAAVNGFALGGGCSPNLSPPPSMATKLLSVYLYSTGYSSFSISPSSFSPSYTPITEVR